MATCVICETDTRSDAQLCRICAERTTGSLNISSISGAIRVAAAVNAERRGRHRELTTTAASAGGSATRAAPPVEEPQPEDRPEPRYRLEDSPLRSPVAGHRPIPASFAVDPDAVPATQGPAELTPTPSKPQPRPRRKRARDQRRSTPPRLRPAERSDTPPPGTTRPPARPQAPSRRRVTRLTGALLLVLILAAGIMGGALMGISMRLTQATEPGQAISAALATQEWLLRLPRMGLLLAIIAVALSLDWSLMKRRQQGRTVTVRRIGSILAFGAAFLVILAVGTSDALTIHSARQANVWLYVACAVLIATAGENYRYVGSD